METPSSTTTTESQVETPAAPSVETPSAADPFQADEALLATLSPEQRTAVEPILGNWKKSAQDWVQKERDKERESIKPIEERAKALDNLVKNPEFVQWWNSRQSPKPTNANPTPSKPQDVASPEEWNTALVEMQNGFPQKWESLNQKMLTASATPIVEKLEQQQRNLALSVEMDNLFRNHPDARDLDKAGILEPFLYYHTDLNKRPMEEAYQAAAKAQAAIMATAKKAALGLVNEKKASVTEGPSQSSKEESVIYVDTPQELLRNQIRADFEGRKVTYALRRK